MLLVKNCHLVPVLTEGVDFAKADVLLPEVLRQRFHACAGQGDRNSHY